MIPLAVALWLSQPVAPPPPPAPAPWRLISTPTVHLGVRPHLLATSGETGAAVTIQLSFNVF